MTTTSLATESRAADDGGRAKPGRPRSEASHQAILDAALRLLVEGGYRCMTMDAIAATAHVGKPTIYRRWRSKAELLVDALRAHVAAEVPLPDTGDVRADLLTILEAMRAAMAGSDGAIMAAFVAEKARDAELAAEFERVFVADRRAHLRHLVRAGIERGQLAATTDVELVADIGPALLWHHKTLRHEPPGPDLPARIVAQLVPAPTEAPRARRRRTPR